MSHLLRQLEQFDYYRGFLSLLEQLTVVNSEQITFEDFKQRVQLLKDSNCYEIWVIEENNKIVGTATLLLEKKFIHKLGCVGHIEDVVVDKQYRGHKFGKLLTEHLIERSKQLGCYKVMLDCSESNIAFYEKCGMTKKERQMVKYF